MIVGISDVEVASDSRDSIGLMELTWPRSFPTDGPAVDAVHGEHLQSVVVFVTHIELISKDGHAPGVLELPIR